MHLRESIRTATIAETEDTSNAIPLRGRMVVGFRMPSAFTGSTITFEGSELVDGTYVPIRDSDGNAVSATVAASVFVGLSGSEADAVSAAPFVKFVSDQAEAAEREIAVVMK
jgi:hypothetical protein